MAQIQSQIVLFALSIIIIGLILVCAGLFLSTRNQDKTQATSKGIVFIGPIPIVWGFSRRIQIILFIVAISFILAWLFWVI